jgi:small subunit ribosomal protein S20
MASSVSAKKRIRQNAKRKSRNLWRKRTMRGSLKVFEDKLQHASVDEAEAAFRDACKILDKTASKGVIHRNAAARKKSRLSARLKARKASG